MSRVNYYQSAFNSIQDKLNILAEMLEISKTGWWISPVGANKFENQKKKTLPKSIFFCVNQKHCSKSSLSVCSRSAENCGKLFRRNTAAGPVQKVSKILKRGQTDTR